MMLAIFWVLTAMMAGAAAWWLAAPLLRVLRERAARYFALAIIGGVPLFALVFYLVLGAAGRPDEALSPRLAGAIEELPTGAVLARLEGELRARPKDQEGWRLLARLYASLGDHDKAINAWHYVIKLGANGEAYVGLARALIESEGGVVSQAAVDWLERALAVDAKNVEARFWRGVAAQQQGDVEGARAIWSALKAELPTDIPFAKMLEAQIHALIVEK